MKKASLQSYWAEGVLMAPIGTQKAVAKHFWKWNLPSIDRETSKGLINACLPLEAGGLGLEPVGGYSTLSLRKITVKQQRLMYCCLKRNSLLDIGRG